jgi:hypothetical protein
MADELDSIVKGAPTNPHDGGLEKTVAAATTPAVDTTHIKNGDPLSTTPCSQPMIYLNLLIMEASFRAQYIDLRARRRLHNFWLVILLAWVSGFTYLLFLAPREDGRGVGGSVYWVVEVSEKLCLMGGVVLSCLVWGTGIWERGVRWPRRWFGISNRGLRNFNCKLVVMRRPWWRELLASAGWYLTYGLVANTGEPNYRYVDPAILREVDQELDLAGKGHPALPILSEDEELGGNCGNGHGHEEDLARGGDYVKLLLLAKPFSPTFRENWELYRTDYWEKENERRGLIRFKLNERDRRLTKQLGGWLWWLPWRRRAIQAMLAKPPAPRTEGERGSLHPHHRHHAAVVGAEHKRQRSSSVRRGSVSAASSRSPTPTTELEDPTGSPVSRKASNSSDKRRKKMQASGGSTSGTGSVRAKRPGVDSRSVTPDIPSPLARESSSASAESASGQSEGRAGRSSPARTRTGGSPAKEQSLRGK